MRTSLPSILAMIAAAPTLGAITFTSIQRGTMISLYVGSSTDWTVDSPATPFADFNSSLSRTLDVAAGKAEAKAFQNSSVSSTGVFTHGGSSVYITPAGLCSGASTESMLNLAFTITTPTPFTLSGFINTWGDVEARGVIRKGDIIIAGADHVTGWTPLDSSGTFAPGDYTITVAGNSFAGSCTGEVSANATFMFALQVIAAPACPGDFNSDGQVDDADFTIFAPAYDELIVPPANALCDLNSDKLVDDADFVLFAIAYNELLCP
jgi:hypothetical protein